MVSLGVNLQRLEVGGDEPGDSGPDPSAAAVLAELGGADEILVTVDPGGRGKRGFSDAEIRGLAASIATRLHLRLPAEGPALVRAASARPAGATLVPTSLSRTRAGWDPLDRSGWREKASRAVATLWEAGISPRLFVPPDRSWVRWAAETGASGVEIDAAAYVGSRDAGAAEAALGGIVIAARAAREAGLFVAAGRGLAEPHLPAILRAADLDEVIVGRGILLRAVSVGLVRAVAEVKYLVGREVPLAPREHGVGGPRGSH